MATTTAAQTILHQSAHDWRQNVPEKYWEFVDQYREELIAHAAAILSSREDAEDVVQETFAEAFRNFDTLAKVESIGDWLKLVNRRNAMNRLRGSRRAIRKISARAQAVPDDTFTTGGFSAVELEESISKAMLKLEPDTREIVELRFWQNLSYKEIARRLKISEDAVQRRMLSATTQLYALLKHQLDSDAKKPR